MSVITFIHSYGVNHYKNILSEFVNNGHDFFSTCNEVHVMYGGEYPSPVPNNAKIHMLPSAEEIESMNIIHRYCQEHPDDKICYIHTKGVTKDNECITDWRKYMFYFCCEQYVDRLKDLETHDTCGVDKRDMPVLHYSGNFWWANANYVASLCSPKDTFSPLTERHKAEFWICSDSKRKHLSVHDCGISVYERHLYRYGPERYRKCN